MIWTPWRQARTVEQYENGDTIFKKQRIANMVSYKPISGISTGERRLTKKSIEAILLTNWEWEDALVQAWYDMEYEDSSGQVNYDDSSGQINYDDSSGQVNYDDSSGPPPGYDCADSSGNSHGFECDDSSGICSEKMIVIKNIEIKVHISRLSRVKDLTVQLYSCGKLVGLNLADEDALDINTYGGTLADWGIKTINPFDIGVVLDYQPHPSMPSSELVYLRKVQMRVLYTWEPVIIEPPEPDCMARSLPDIGKNT